MCVVSLSNMVRAKKKPTKWRHEHVSHAASFKSNKVNRGMQFGHTVARRGIHSFRYPASGEHHWFKRNYMHNEGPTKRIAWDPRKHHNVPIRNLFTRSTFFQRSGAARSRHAKMVKRSRIDAKKAFMRGTFKNQTQLALPRELQRLIMSYLPK